ncbi:MAG TPA: transglycosylase family protein [Solirubrobacteraceae bacterium]|nr:transglycosylase family protein [Solirubrobacteraceae bacterium]
MAVALAAAGALAALAAMPMASSAQQSLNQLNSELGQQQSHQHALEGNLAGLSQLIGSLSGQISLVQSREAAVQTELTQDRARLLVEEAALTREEDRLAMLRARLSRSRGLLARQLVSNYESGNPDLVSVILESNGFKDLLEKVTYLRDAEHQQQVIIAITRAAKASANAAARRLTALELKDRQTTYDAFLQERALAGMNSLLSSKQSALKRAQAIKQAALSASRAKSGQIQAEISQIEAQQAAQRAAAAQAAEQAAQASQGGSQSAPVSTGPALGPSGGWAIPYQVVLCESGGQDLPPNSAGASGYYQILPSTWKGAGGSGPAAYLAPKAEQDAVASRLWDGGAGASNWVCATMLGIH